MDNLVSVMYLLFAVPDYLQNCSLKEEFSPRHFVAVSQEKSKKVSMEDEQSAVLQQDGSSSELLTCPNKESIRIYQHHSSLEKHL